VPSNGKLALRDSSEILRWCHLGAPSDWNPRTSSLAAEAARQSVLYPNGRTPEIATLEQKFDEKLGPHVRRWAYWQLFRPGQTGEAAARILSAGPLPKWQRAVAPPALPLLRLLLMKGLNISSSKAALSLERVERIFEEVDEVLADGRLYLTGDQFTGVDLTFASLASFSILPAELWLTEQKLMTLAHLNPQAQEEVGRLSETGAGKLILRCYRHHYQ